jgi:signal transduction histidine kinase
VLLPLFFLEASNSFEMNRDTVGMLASYAYLVKLNQGEYRTFVGDKNIAINYFDKISAISQQCQRPWAKLIGFNAIITYSKQLKATTLQQQQEAYQNAIRIMKQNPKLAYYRPSITNNMGVCYGLINDYTNQFDYQFKAYELLRGKDLRLGGLFMANIADACFNRKMYSKAEKYYKKALELNQKHKGSIAIIEHIYASTASCQLFLGKYEEAWESKVIDDSLKIVFQAEQKSKSLLDIQTKYETKKKEAENQVLRLEAESNQQKIWIVSLITFSLLLFSLTLIHFYRKNEAKKKKLENLNQDLHHINQRMEYFTHALSHDAMSYINHILNYATLGVTIVSENPEMQAVVKAIHRNGHRLKKMSENLISFNLMRRNQQAPTLFGLSNVIAEVVEDIEFDFTGDNQLELPPEMGIVLKGNREFMKQVLRNLLDNAIKFRRPNVPLHLQIGSEIKTTNKVVITVQDNGMGIAADKLSMVFKEFTKGNSLMEGSGLGLFIAQQIIEDMGGQIEVHSEIGNGSCFTCTLPMSLKQTVPEY